MTMSIYVCKDEPAADRAVAYLVAQQFPAGGVTKEKVDNFNYDAKTYNADAGPQDDYLTPRWVVIGRK